MNKKKLAALLMAALICVMMTGCAVDTAANEAPSDEATAAPTEAPKTGIEAVFGKPVTLAIVSNGDDASSALFFEAAAWEAQSMGVTVTIKAAGGAFDAAVNEAAQTADAVVAFLPEPVANYSALGALDIPATVFEAQKGDVPSSLSHLFYEPDGELDLAFHAALTYPPHETPVRLILLFESADSPAYAAYQELFDEGKIFPKEVYIASDIKTPVGEWLTGKLDGYVAGMLDAVFAENAALAVSACDALAALDRTDMEVFCPGVTADVIARMQSNPKVFAQAVGRHDALAGVLSVRAALKMLYGEQAVTQAFEPMLINAADMGGDATGSEIATQFHADWMDTLRSFYGTAEGTLDVE